jgi:hypothetical protein
LKPWSSGEESAALHRAASSDHVQEALCIAGHRFGVRLWQELSVAANPRAHVSATPSKPKSTAGAKLGARTSAGTAAPKRMVAPSVVSSSLPSAAEQSGAESPLPSDEAYALIETIRREEFGITSKTSNDPNSVRSRQDQRLGRALKRLSGELYGDNLHWQLELVQNGDDNKYVSGVIPAVEFIVDTTSIIVLNNEIGFQPSDVRALCDIGNSSKVMRQTEGEQTIGEKGLGFKSVFAVTDCPQLFSRGFRLQFDCTHPSGLGYVLPEALDESKVPKEAEGWNTAFRLPWKDQVSAEQRDGMIRRMAQLSSALPLFLKQLRKIAVTTPAGRTNFEMVDLERPGGRRVYCGGDRHEDWLVVHQDLAVPEGVSKPSANEGKQKKTSTNLQIAIPLAATGGIDASRGPLDVHAFLPVRSYGFRIAIQGDWVVSS